MDTTLIKLNQSQMGIGILLIFNTVFQYLPMSTSVCKIVIFLSHSLECHKGEPLQARGLGHGLPENFEILML